MTKRGSWRNKKLTFKEVLSRSERAVVEGEAKGRGNDGAKRAAMARAMACDSAAG